MILCCHYKPIPSQDSSCFTCVLHSIDPKSIQKTIVQTIENFQLGACTLHLHLLFYLLYLSGMGRRCRQYMVSPYCGRLQQQRRPFFLSDRHLSSHHLCSQQTTANNQNCQQVILFHSHVPPRSSSSSTTLSLAKALLMTTTKKNINKTWENRT